MKYIFLMSILANLVLILTLWYRIQLQNTLNPVHTENRQIASTRAPTFHLFTDSADQSGTTDTTFKTGPALTFLTAAKQRQVSRILFESELEEQRIVDNTQGFRTANDGQKIDAILKSRDEAIEQILTEEEWRKFQHEESGLGKEIHSLLEGISYDEEMFGELYKFREAQMQRLEGLEGDLRLEANEAANEEFIQAMSSLLGAPAAAQIQRNADPSFRTVSAFVKRFQLPSEASVVIYDGLQKIYMLDEEPVNLDDYPDGTIPERENERQEILRELQKSMSNEAYTEFGRSWFGQ